MPGIFLGEAAFKDLFGKKRSQNWFGKWVKKLGNIFH